MDHFASDVIDQDARQYGRLWAPIAEKYRAKLNAIDARALAEAHTSSGVLAVKSPSYEQAKTCYNDPAYVQTKEFAVRASRRELIIIEGDFA
ncbi:MULTISPECIES: DUF1330 domain-containing protein [Pseudomonas]|uniref:DUF1330 domain-containing protein n=1 Tax=Pseudomonas TaxID=286 RepID=UPI0009A43476|nr:MULTISPECIES: DUF1330 domain-containing protein [Pseudomonas]HBN9689314.1 DUF1330 domain-containing protein [Pseudomonas aeruginosa]